MDIVDIKTATQLANRDSENLVPIIGAGISVPLGLPSWKELITLLTSNASIKVDLDNVEYPPLFQEIKFKLGETAFNSILQQNLTIDVDVTSTALQAIVNSGVKKLITTNLDYSIELAYKLAGFPIEPHHIGRGNLVEDFFPFFLNNDSTILLKIHGSLEKPSTWVITSEDYNRAYIQPGNLQNFLIHNVQIPLFIGFSLSDYDIEQCIRIAKHIKGGRSFILMEIGETQKLYQKLKENGIIPLQFHKFDQIPEIIDDIFRCKSLKILKNTTLERDLSVKEATIHIGAAKTIVPNSINNDTTLKTLIDILGNALEFQPPNSIVDGLPRRETGIKNDYRNKLKSLFSNNDVEAAKVLFNAFTYYPEILTEGALSSVLSSPKTDQFLFLELLFSAIPVKNIKLVNRVEENLLSCLTDKSLRYQVRRDITKILAKRGRHPGVLIPPPTVLINDLYVPIYPLTKYQVGYLKGDKEQIKNPSVLAYTIISQDEIIDILSNLSIVTGKKWRLPTKDEWLTISSISITNKWPWGNQNPEYHQHAHLKYLYKTGEIPQSVLEVGLFPEGVSDRGIFDLIGNVYEAVIGPSGLELAGGGWSTKFDPIRPDHFTLITKWGHGKSNVGIRPICE